MQELRTRGAPSLFTPIEVGPLQLRNRVVMAPLTLSRAGPGNVPTQLNALYYAQRASAGLIISEATQIAPEGQGYISTPGIHSAEQIAGWTCVTQALHIAGGHIVCQLWHVGRVSHPSFQPGGLAPVAPSAIKPNGQAFTAKGFEPIPTPRALETAEIPAIVAQYAQAARNAMAAGFDGVEVHAANGYLIDQFLRDQPPHRPPMAAASRIAAGSCWRWSAPSPLRSAQSASACESRRRTVRTTSLTANRKPCSTMWPSSYRAKASPISTPSKAIPPAVPPFEYQKLKDLFGGMVIANNGFDKKRANEAIAEGRADVIAFGKPFIANPDLVIRLFLDAPLMPVNRDTLYGGSEHGYTDYPILRAVAPDACYHDADGAWG
jgi:N-ethylmaleimide reductase